MSVVYTQDKLVCAEAERLACAIETEIDSHAMLPQDEDASDVDVEELNDTKSSTDNYESLMGKMEAEIPDLKSHLQEAQDVLEKDTQFKTRFWDEFVNWFGKKPKKSKLWSKWSRNGDDGEWYEQQPANLGETAPPKPSQGELKSCAAPTPEPLMVKVAGGSDAPRQHAKLPRRTLGWGLPRAPEVIAVKVEFELIKNLPEHSLVGTIQELGMPHDAVAVEERPEKSTGRRATEPWSTR